jgi:hypothetical protein
MAKKRWKARWYDHATGSFSGTSPWQPDHTNVIMDVAHTETFARSCRGPTSTFQRDGIRIGHVFPSQPQGRHATTRSIGVRRTTSHCTRHVGGPNNACPHQARGQHPVAAARTRWRHGGRTYFIGYHMNNVIRSSFLSFHGSLRRSSRSMKCYSRMSIAIWLLQKRYGRLTFVK